MGLLAWLVVGALAGTIAGMVTGRRDQGCITRIAIGVLGAFVGGALARAAGYEGVTEFGLRAILVSALGASLLLLVLEAVGGRGRSRLDR